MLGFFKKIKTIKNIIKLDKEVHKLSTDSIASECLRIYEEVYNYEMLIGISKRSDYKVYDFNLDNSVLIVGYMRYIDLPFNAHIDNWTPENEMNETLFTIKTISKEIDYQVYVTNMEIFPWGEPNYRVFYDGSHKNIKFEDDEKIKREIFITTFGFLARKYASYGLNR